MTDQEKVAELIKNSISMKVLQGIFQDAYYVNFKIDFEEFKKQMLSILLTKEEKLKLIAGEPSRWREDVVRRQTRKKYKLNWRDFEKEKPKDCKYTVAIEEGDFIDSIFCEENNKFIDSEHRRFKAKYWIYKEELEATLPGGENGF